MTKKELKEISVPIKPLTGMIYEIRGQKVMLSTHLADLYDVEPRVLVQAVKRNIERFPKDFMFKLTKEEFGNLKSQFVISSWGGMRRSTPYTFTEQGVAMSTPLNAEPIYLGLSSVLNSDRAIQVNIQIMRTFTRLRKILVTHKDLKRKIEAMEKRYDENFRIVFEAIKQLFDKEEKPKPRIGYIKEKTKAYGKKRAKN
jgi:hypothetical protein